MRKNGYFFDVTGIPYKTDLEEQSLLLYYSLFNNSVTLTSCLLLL